MDKQPLLSLCIPTNGVTEWVIPVIDSIYENKANIEEFEVVVTDNGNNTQFENKMLDYRKLYSNFVYSKTDAKLFQNQIEAFKLANGQLIKFVNHRMTLLPNSVIYLIDFVKNYSMSNPTVYFSNGFLCIPSKLKCCGSFDEYVRTLSYFSSWSAGTAIWKSELEQMNLSLKFNTLFPHTDIIFNNKTNTNYIIDDTLLMKEIPVDVTKKGNYDLFDAFAVQYPLIIKNLYKDREITRKTFNYVIRKNSYFVSSLFLDYIIKKEPCSYNLGGYKKSMGIFYSDIEIKCKAFLVAIKRIFKRIAKR